MRKTFFISLYYTFYIFFTDFIYALLNRFYNNWISSFILLPSITLIVLLLIRIWKRRFYTINPTIRKIDFHFFLRIIFICLCLYIYAALLYPLIDDNYRSNSAKKINYVKEGVAMILAAIGEEFFFRGYLLYYALKDISIKNKLPKMFFFSILTSILFSLAHRRVDLYVFQYFIFSMIASLIYIRSQLFYTIIFHSTYNIMVLFSLGKALQIDKLNITSIIIGLFLSISIIAFQLLKLKHIKVSIR
ncbi:lysostaphin resistance A-like protein [Flavobacterium tructae]|uniref:CPBP family intramembrane glutamic endopeptidase n=1 Tax=Flavobacterium tructae TaxID=1114873 RepID=UPI0035A967A6